MAQTVRQLGKYCLVAQLATGGMGNVYLAIARGLGGFNKLCVIKELKASLLEPEYQDMFFDEARLAARLNHPNIVQTNEVGEDHGTYFMAMEYLEGRTLHAVRREHGAAVPARVFAAVLVQVLRALEYAHQLEDFDGQPLGIVHRDVTPQNIFFTYGGQVKLLDFGIAKARDSINETREGLFKGKLPYMAPEQARAEEVDVRSDIFSVGAILAEVVTGRKLWQGLSQVQILERLFRDDVPGVRALAPPGTDERALAVCEQALSAPRDARFSSAGAMARAIEQAFDLGHGGAAELAALADVVAAGAIKQREEIRAVIEAQLRKIREATAADARSEESIDLVVLPAPVPSSARLLTLESAAPVSTPAAPVAASPSATAGARRPALLLVLAGAALVLALVGRWVSASRAPRAAATSNGEPALPESLPPPASARAPAPALLRVVVEPREAAVSIDGIAGREASVAPGSAHVIEARLAGYRPARAELTVTADVATTVVLEREAPHASGPSLVVAAPYRAPAPAPPPRPAASVAAAPTPAASAPVAADSLSVTPHRPHRSIDSDSPYPR